MRIAAWGLAMAVAGCGAKPLAPVPAGPLQGAPIDAAAPPATTAATAQGPTPSVDLPTASASAPAPAPEATPTVTDTDPDPAANTDTATDPAAVHQISFADLEAWAVPRKRLPEQLPEVPAALAALDGQRVSIAGYVLIDRMGDGKRIQTAIFIKHLLACCFGQMPKLNEWVHLEVAPDAELEFNLYRPVRIDGTFLIGPHRTGEISHALFRIRVTRMLEDPDYRG